MNYTLFNYVLNHVLNSQTQLKPHVTNSHIPTLISNVKFHLSAFRHKLIVPLEGKRTHVSKTKLTRFPV